MSNDNSIVKGKTLLAELANICRGVSDDDMLRLFEGGSIEELLTAILDPQDAGKFPSIADYFLANKNRASLMAALRVAIMRSYSIEITKKGVKHYVSPSAIQWFEDGVMILEGKQPFEGLLGLYRNGRLSYGMAVRDIAEGEQVGPDALEFIDIEIARQHFYQISPPTQGGLDKPLGELLALLEICNPDESEYQELFSLHPWVLGLHYDKLQRHEHLDDQNIPDFTAVRVSDHCRDIFELKPPSMPVFRNDGEFTAEFNAAWNQAERYLHFAREEKDYLARKGFRFDNPKCFLVCGYKLPKELVARVRVKEKMNPAIQLMTFDDLVAFMRSTIAFIKRLANDGSESTA